MKKKTLINTFLISLFLASTISAYSDTIYQFEDGVPKNFSVSKTSKLSITDEKAKDGKNSLKWNFKGKDTLVIKGDTEYKVFDENSKEKARSSYAMWIYNKKPINDKMKVEFKKGGKVKSSFEINMNFEGWRTMWVQYDRDMKGTPEVGMDEIVLTAPNSNGEILIDQLYPSVKIDPRHNARDEQVDFVNLGADSSPNAHWMALYKNYNRIKHERVVKNISEEKKLEIAKIENKYKENIMKKVDVTPALIGEYKEKMNECEKLTLISPQTKDLYRDFSEEQKANLKDFQIVEYGKMLRELGFMYNSTDNKEYKAEIYSIFQKGLDHLFDQGWAKGSSQGTIHHLGYQVREIYQAIFLMKEPLQQSGNLKKAKEMVTWYSAMGILYTPQNEIKGVNIDVLNTMLPGMLIAALLNEDKNIEEQEITQLKNYLSKSIEYAPGLLGGFKEDGAVFHHMQNYPAYAKGAFDGLTPIMYYLGNTSFALDNFDIVKKAILMSRVYANKSHWLLTLGGRHPHDELQISHDVIAYAAYGKEEGVDKELAEAYLRLVPEGKFADEFKKLGFKAESAPNGSWTMNMGSLQLQRRGEWLAGVKGFSRYLVGNETYIKNNLYGRYMSYGTFQILEKSLKDSGFVQKGWNWAHYPGTTAIALPLDKMKVSISQVDTYSGVEEMLLSDETYSGGNSLNNNGMFAMKLHENPKYNGSHRARKSVFFFDNRAVLLGSDIENDDTVNETHTTLFQNYLGENKVKDEKKNLNGDNFILDSQNNLYKVVNGEVVYTKGLQKSFDQKVGTPTENNYELAYINHGTNPKEKAYEYAVLIKGDSKEQSQFKKDSGYKVLQKDYNAHIVQDTVSNLRGYALFEAGEIKNDEFVKSTDTPSMIMVAPEKNNLTLSFVDPDLRLYEGRDESQYDENGRMKEVSIYSRVEWNGNNSIPHTSTVVLKGEYKLSEKLDNVSVEVKNNETILKVTTVYAKPVEIKLEKR
ncbi:chondroitinase family polysaccharide lyase [Fusobacterium sp.]|uniref:chondroitinase family polysaccharide lyase n=1 Tax=Fusobacterium sp. TaxID=68766 RepID=UPI0026250DE8|nr:chondroitinase family polysaccharide lyase [Fusobacterium sp.]